MTRAALTAGRTPQGAGTPASTPRRRRVRGAALAALGALLLGGGLSGCGDDPARPGSALIRGDHRISEAELQEAVTNINASIGVKNGDPKGVPQRLVLMWLMADKGINEKGKELGLSITEAEIDQRMKEVAEQTSPKAKVPPVTGLGREALRSYWTFGKIAEGLTSQQRDEELRTWYDELVKDLIAEGVALNPRYGVFRTPDPLNAQTMMEFFDYVGDRPANWLSTNTPSPSPTASPTGAGEQGDGQQQGGDQGQGDGSGEAPSDGSGGEATPTP